MKLQDSFALSGFHTSIATTFCIDFDAYESIVLSRLRGAGCNNNLVLADAGMLAQALDAAATLPVALASARYTATGARSPGVFHPKIFLQIGRERVRLQVGSANLTAPGLGGNLEVVGLVDAPASDESVRGIVAAAWRYLRSHIDTTQPALSYQIEWMLQRAPWLERSAAADEPVALAGGGEAMFLAGDGSEGLARRFAQLVGSGPVRRLICVSPYWDHDLLALRGLAGLLNADRVAVALGGSAPSFPAHAAASVPGLRLYDMDSLVDSRKHRFVHAKLIVAQTDVADHVLFGSANCTVPALAAPDKGWANDEACLYRRMRRNEAVEALKLDAVLKSAPVDPAGLKYLAGERDQISKRWEQRSTGRVEYAEGLLHWWPAPALDGDATLELLSIEREPQSCRLTPVTGLYPGCRSYQASDLPDTAGFAIARVGDIATAPTPIVRLDALREIVREPRSKQTQREIDRLAQDDEEGLWVLEAFDMLAALESQAPAHPPVGSKASESKADADVSRDYRTLTYEAFVAHRRQRSPAALPTRRYLAGSELAAVADFLNRALGLATRGKVASEDDSELEARFKASVIEEELEDGTDGPGSGATAAHDNAPRPRRVPSFDQAACLAVTSREKIASMVDAFVQTLKADASSSQFDLRDAVRLRIVLLVVLAAARPAAGAVGSSPRQVISATASPQWPRLVGQALNGMFCGDAAAIRRMRLDSRGSDWPVELIECWACCAWALNAACQILEGVPPAFKLAKFLNDLRPKVYRGFGLRADQVAAKAFAQVYAAMSGRFAARLLLDPLALEHLHEVEVERLTARGRP